jgi:hypothetical protein
MPVNEYPVPPDATQSVLRSERVRSKAECERQPKPPLGGRGFDSRMADVGWIRSQAWSAWFIEIVYSHVFRSSASNPENIFSGSCIDIFRKMCISFHYQQSATPTPGAIAFWQYGNSWMGHAGIVLQCIGNKHFTCIEAHNPTGTEDGFSLKIKTRKIKSVYQPSGLNLMGFIFPPDTS